MIWLDIFFVIFLAICVWVSYIFKYLLSTIDMSYFFSLWGFALTFIGVILSYISLRNVLMIKKQVAHRVNMINIMQTAEECLREIESFIPMINESGEISFNIRVSYLKCLNIIKETFKCVDGRKNKEYKEIEKLASNILALSQSTPITNSEIIVFNLVELSAKLKSIKEKILAKDG